MYDQASKKIRGWASQFLVMLSQTWQVIFSVSRDINYSEQKFAKETFRLISNQTINKSLQSLVVSVYVIYGSLAVPK